MKIQVMSVYGKPLFLSQRQYEARELVLWSGQRIKDISALIEVQRTTINKWITGVNEPTTPLYEKIINELTKIKCENLYGRTMYLTQQQYNVRCAVLGSNHKIDIISHVSGVSVNAICRWMTALNEPKRHLYESVMQAAAQLAKVPRVKLRNERENIYNMRESGMEFPEIAARYGKPTQSINSAYVRYKKDLNKNLQSV